VHGCRAAPGVARRQAAVAAAALLAAAAPAREPGRGGRGRRGRDRGRLGGRRAPWPRPRGLEFTPPLAALREEPSPSPDKVPPLQPSPGAAGVLLHPSTSNPFAEICVAAAALPAPGAHDAADGGAPAPAPLEHTAAATDLNRIMADLGY